MTCPPSTLPRLNLVCLLAALAFAALSGCAPPVDDPAGPGDGAGAVDDSLAGDVRVRLMAANITSGNLQSYDPGEGIRIFQGTDPDVAMIQEFNYGTNSAADLRSFVDQAFGTSFSYCREGGAQIPNGVISRYPIISCAEWDDPRVTNRDFEVALIDLPGSTNLWAISVHLLTTSTTERDLEAQSLVSFIQSNVPAGDWVAIGGDFNTGSTTESCLTRLSAVVVTSAPRPADRNGNTFTNAGRTKPYDWVLVSSGMNSKQTGTVIGASTFAGGLVADTRVYSPISEISPALSTDSGAVNMQHMGVLKDFLVPSGTAASVTVTSPNGGESWTSGTSHSITWTSSGLTNVKIEYTLDGSTWTTAASSVAASGGSWSWTVPSATTSSARVRVSDAAGGGATDTSDGAFTISPPATSAAVFLNEICANEPGSDVNQEFVEVVNSGGTAADLSGWTVSDSTGVRHTFAAGSSLAAGAAVVVFGAASGIPAGLTNAVASSTGALGLGNSGDSVILRNGGGTQVDAITYPSSLSSTDGVSMNRSPDAASTGSWVLHTSLSSLVSSPGKRVDGTDFGGSPPPPPPPGSISAETEPNDGATTVNGPIGNGKAVSGAISTSTDQDWFRIPVKSAGTLSINLTINAAADLDWFLSTESNPTTVLARGYTTANPETGSYAAAANTVYLLKVNGYLGATAPYTLTITAPSATLDP
ncbi:MAG TPA: lamin tail domain-containing protein [Myxococcales bacterium]|nr:lamin tail domain-containing protein [Myxococcales bacterium]